MQIDIIISLCILIISVIIHELAHGYAANALGDPTARLAGRLTLNPLVHIDPIGSIIMPVLLALAGSSIIIGYAKPVPYNPYNLRGKYGEALVAGAGPAANIALAVLFGLAIRFIGTGLSDPMLNVFSSIVFMNILLAVFNLIPIPPLDGSKVLSGILPHGAAHSYNLFRANFERLGIFSGTILILIIFSILSPMFYGVIWALFRLVTGIVTA